MVSCQLKLAARDWTIKKKWRTQNQTLIKYQPSNVNTCAGFLIIRDYRLLKPFNILKLFKSRAAKLRL